jgi:hypothetical protein
MAPEVGANLVTILEYNAEVDMWSIGVRKQLILNII